LFKPRKPKKERKKQTKEKGIHNNQSISGVLQIHNGGKGVSFTKRKNNLGVGGFSIGIQTI
jgi:hypothetical protein